MFARLLRFGSLTPRKQRSKRKSKTSVAVTVTPEVEDWNATLLAIDQSESGATPRSEKRRSEGEITYPVSGLTSTHGEDTLPAIGSTRGSSQTGGEMNSIGQLETLSNEERLIAEVNQEFKLIFELADRRISSDAELSSMASSRQDDSSSSLNSAGSSVVCLLDLTTEDELPPRRKGGSTPRQEFDAPGCGCFGGLRCFVLENTLKEDDDEVSCLQFSAVGLG